MYFAEGRIRIRCLYCATPVDATWTYSKGMLLFPSSYTQLQGIQNDQKQPPEVFLKISQIS